MSFHFLGDSATNRADVPVGDPDACEGQPTARGSGLFDRPCVNLEDMASIAELKALFHEASGYAVRDDTALWTPDEENNLWLWAVDQTKVRRPSGDDTIAQLLLKTPSGWVYPSGWGLHRLWTERKCGDACASRYPLLAAIAGPQNTGLLGAAVRPPRLGVPGGKGTPPANEVPPDEPPPGGHVAAGASAGYALAGVALVAAGWLTLRLLRRPRRQAA